MELPKDNFILLSYINTKLRDDFSSLEELCDSLDISKSELCLRLAAIDYNYDPTVNCFV